ncbi:hypothetical protein GCM10027046_11770 [Uliginosibacterium flavum]
MASGKGHCVLPECCVNRTGMKSALSLVSGAVLVEAPAPKAALEKINRGACGYGWHAELPVVAPTFRPRKARDLTFQHL